MIAVYIIMAVACYLFVAYAMHIDKDKMLKFMVVLGIFMTVLLMSPVYEELRTPYMLIYWPLEFGVMLYVCDTAMTMELRSLKRVPISAGLVVIAVGCGAWLQPEPVTARTLVLSVAPACVGAFMGLIRRIAHAKLV